MHWAYQIAEKLINKHPKKEVFTCASGISPSGSVHVGNFREVLTTYFVVKALENLGKKARFIFSWDDFDRLRKIPQNIPESYQTYLGIPYSEVPNPFGEGSYAIHFEKEFEEALLEFDIKPEFIYQNREYRSGRYAPYISIALKRRKEIYDIFMQFKSTDPKNEDREAFYPLSLYCEGCSKDTTIITHYNEEQNRIDYECCCGKIGSQEVSNSRQIKLNWKVDWAMRWMVEDVVFEPGGRDHSSATGSYNVSKVIAKEIFNFEAPDYTAYEFIGLKGTNHKMSSSLGNVITPKDLLNIYTPEIILFMFAKYKPNAAFNIGFDDEVIRTFSEFERYQNTYAKGMLQDENIIQSLILSKGDVKRYTPSFSQVAGIFPLIDFNELVMQNALITIGETYALEELKIISDRVAYWIKHWNQHRMIKVNEEKNEIYYRTLSDEQKEKLRILTIFISNEAITGDFLMKEVYAICYHEDKKAMKESQKNLFKHVYQLVLNLNNGPRLPLLISAIGRKKISNLLTFSQN